MITTTHRRRGFSLIEAAIVLAVVGLVIGGIWVSAAKVMEDWRTMETINGIISIKSGVQKLISIKDSETLGNVYYLGYLVGSAIEMPTGWEKRSGNYFKTSISNPISLTTKTNPTGFNFAFLGVKKADCIKIVSRISALQAPSGSYNSGIGLGLIKVFDMDGGGIMKISTTTFPVTPTQAEGACVDRNNEVQLFFGYTRTN